MKPVFKLDEVVVKDTYDRGTGADYGTPKEQVGVVLYTGAEVTRYIVGEKVFYDYGRGKQIALPNGEKLLIFSEKYIFCGLTE